MDVSTDWVIIGRFGRTHGIRGNIVINSFTEPFDGIQQYETCLYAFICKQWQSIKIRQLEIRSKTIVAQIEGYDSVEQVSVLTNTEIAIPKDKLPALPIGEYYWHDLIGMRVENNHGITLGSVTEIMSTGSNDVLIVEGNKRHLVPYIPGQFVLNIDKKDQLIIVDWDEEF